MDEANSRIVYIKGRALLQKITGVQRFTLEFLQNLDAMIGEGLCPANIRWIVAIPKCDVSMPVFANLEFRQIGSHQGHYWEQIELPRAARDGVLVSLGGAPVVSARRQVVVMHDAAAFDFPQSYSRKFAMWYRFTYKAAVRHGNVLCTVSEFSRERLAEKLGIERSRFHVVDSSGAHYGNLDEDDLIFSSHPELLQRPYVLAVGSQSLHKNFRLVEEAARRMPELSFVGVGRINTKVFGGADMGDDAVRMLEGVSDQQLKSLYRRAACFVFPSLYEGFGLPPLEAMMCDCPVVCSNAASMPEVCGDAPLYFSPNSVEELCAQLSRVIGEDKLRAQMIIKGQRQTKLHTWRKTAEMLLPVILGACEGGR